MTIRPRGQRRIPQRRDRAATDPYGREHRQRRAALLAYLASVGSAPCALCGQEMTVAMKLHLHHSDPLAALAGLPGDVLVHGRCNVSAGGREGAAITNGTPRKPEPRTWDTKPREVRTGYGKSAMLADSQRCQSCKDNAIRWGTMNPTCWMGTCGEASTGVIASGP